MKKIIVADDDPGILFLFTEILSDQYEIHTVSNGKDLIDYIQKDDYSLIITDLFMPDMDGLESLMEIRKMNKKVPIICVTGFEDTSMRGSYLEIAKSLGAIDTFLKPFSIHDVRESVARNIG